VSVEKEHLGEVGDTARAGIDRTVEYMEGVAERTADYVEDAVEQTRERLVELRKHGVEGVWTDLVRLTKRKPERALLLAAAIGLIIGILSQRGER
jgi:ElaB/YqjD/DUF883 family membrane-anchored ribosome-binding protein